MGRQSITILFLLLLTFPSLAQTAFDPLNIGVGARALGMGKAFAAVAEDGDTIFTNPAGLGEIDSFKFTSMSGTVLDEVKYTLLGGVFPLGGKAAIGFGYVNAGVSGIDIRNSSGTLQRQASFGDSVYFAAFGKKITETLSLGMNIKLYYETGIGVDDGNGSGSSLDIGLLQKGLGWSSLGIVAQNILSSKIRYKNGEEEALAPVIKVGTRLHLFGNEFESVILSPAELSMIFDADLSLQPSKPSTSHLGIEFAPVDILIFRAGWDEDPKPGGTQSIFTSGVSLKYAGIGFHYAFHPYGDPPTATHYFSISFDERGWPFEGPADVFQGSRPCKNLRAMVK